jgi:hypothetical protein
MNIDVIRLLLNARQSIRMTFGVAAGEEKKAEEGTVISPSEDESKFNAVAVADPPDAQNQTPATVKEVFSILINCRN